MNRLPLAALALLAVAALAAACETTEEPPSTQTPAATAAPTVSPAPTPQLPAGAKAIFIEGNIETFPPSGELWISGLDGSERRRITPAEVAATFAGVTRLESGGPLIYYVTSDDETVRSVWRVNLDSGEREAVLQFEGPDSRAGGAAVSPDGGYVAYAALDGLSVFDLATGERKSLLGGTVCPDNPAIRCVYYMLPQWSADGRLVAVERGFAEGGSQTVVDPFSDPPQELIEANTGEGPMWGSWSASGESLCAYGLYAASGGVYLAETPAWAWRNLLPDYENPNPNEVPPIDRSATGCAWLADGRIAFTAVEVNNLTPTPGGPPEKHHLFAIDPKGGEPALLADLRAEGAGYPRLLTDVGGTVVLVQDRIPVTGGASRGGQASLVDVSNGAMRPVLREGDYVVAVVGP